MEKKYLKHLFSYILCILCRLFTYYTATVNLPLEIVMQFSPDFCGGGSCYRRRFCVGLKSSTDKS